MTIETPKVVAFWEEDAARRKAQIEAERAAYNPETLFSRVQPLAIFPVSLPRRRPQVRQWQWQEMPAYLGFSHTQRVRLWQFQWWLIEHGVIQKAHTCTVCGSIDHRAVYHAENYFDFRTCMAICQRCHRALHRRSYDPTWADLVSYYSRTGEEWFRFVPPAGFDMQAHMIAKHGPGVEDLFSPTFAPPANLPRMVMDGEGLQLIDGHRIRARSPKQGDWLGDYQDS